MDTGHLLSLHITLTQYLKSLLPSLFATAQFLYDKEYWYMEETQKSIHNSLICIQKSPSLTNVPWFIISNKAQHYQPWKGIYGPCVKRRLPHNGLEQDTHIGASQGFQELQKGHSFEVLQQVASARVFSAAIVLSLIVFINGETRDVRTAFYIHLSDNAPTFSFGNAGIRKMRNCVGRSENGMPIFVALVIPFGNATSSWN